MVESINNPNLKPNVGVAHHFQSLLQRFELTPGRISLIYLVFGFSALYLSDVFLVRFFDDPLLSELQTLKGSIEIVVTAGLIFVLTHGSRTPLELEADRLKRHREELQVLHRILRHNLRNDLNVISGYAALLYEHTGDDDPKDWCEDIMKNVDNLLEYAEKASTVRKISDGHTSTVDLSKTIPHIIEKNQQLTEADAVSVNLPEEARVEANHMLDVAIDELLSNAVQHNDPSSLDVAVTVDSDPGPMSTTQILIEDNGSGIPENELEVLDRRVEDPLLHMSGLGLWMVHWTVIESNGTMEIDADETGTRISLMLPSALDFQQQSMANLVG